MSTQCLFVAAIGAVSQELKIDSAKLQAQIQIMDQSLAIMLLQLCCSKISFIVLVPAFENAAEVALSCYVVRRRAVNDVLLPGDVSSLRKIHFFFFNVSLRLCCQ